jgi:tetrahydromethanopterin S-methyltransferase subunit G
MKTYLDAFLKKFSQSRDALLVLLVIGGIFFFMQKSQAVKEQNPDMVWQDKWGQTVRPPVTDPGQGEAGATTGGVASAAEIFRTVQFKDIESMSTRPVFQSGEEYNRLRIRLEALKKDYTDAQSSGETRNAIEKLSQYCKDDPKGTILDWPTPPQIILTNLICEQTSQSLSSAIDSAKGVSQTTAGEGELYQGIESLDKAHVELKRAIDEASANPECTADPKGESRVVEAKSLLDSLGQAKTDLHAKLLQQEYNNLTRDGGALDAKSTAESVAELVQRLRNFRDLQSKLDPNGSIVNQTQVDRLQEIQTKIESGKEARMAQVRQRIGALTAIQGYEANSAALQEILKMFDTLKMLEDPKADSDRKEFEGYQQKIEAAAILEEMGKMLDTAEMELEKIPKMVTDNEDYRASAKAVSEALDHVDEMRKKPGVKRANQAAYREVYGRFQKLGAKWKQLKPKLRLE